MTWCRASSAAWPSCGSPRTRSRRLRRRLAQGRAEELAATAVDGVIVGRLDGLPRDDYRELVTTLRARPGMRAVVVAGEAEAGGVALVAAVTPESGLNAGELIADAARLVKGGGGKGAELAVAGGKEVAGIDSALESVRGAITGR